MPPPRLPRPILRLLVITPCLLLVLLLAFLLHADLEELAALRSQAKQWGLGRKDVPAGLALNEPATTIIQDALQHAATTTTAHDARRVQATRTTDAVIATKTSSSSSTTTRAVIGATPSTTLTAAAATPAVAVSSTRTASSTPTSPPAARFVWEPREYRVTDPRFDDYVIGLKSGIEVAVDKVPIQLLTFLRSVKNIWLFGDGNMKVGDVEMHDVVTGLYEQTEARLRQVGKWEEANTPRYKLKHHDTKVKHPRVEDHPDEAHPPAGQSGASGNKELHKRATPAHDREILPDQKSQGWKLDAHKNIPAVKEMYKRFPNAKWYIMIDDDSYVFMENLHHLLLPLNSSEPHYIGAPNHFRGCDGVDKIGDGPMFGHGGSGIVLSHEAVRRMVEVADDCVFRYRPCWAGDVRLGLCLRDAGVKISYMFPGRRYFNPVTPHWSVHPYYEDPCKRVVTFHHLSQATMQKLHDIERFVHNRTAETLGRVSPPRGKFPHLDQPEGSVRHPAFAHLPAAVPSAFYAPIHLEDLWYHFVDLDPNLPDIEPDTSRPGEIYKVWTGAHDANHCRLLCERDERCRAWEFEPKGGRCNVKDSITRSVPAKGHAAGLIKYRFRCRRRTF
ncbi:hypothetical protein AMAG_00853 [Allomyces macrogynus ATCC 38327]|uniref:N-acetylgalactosaminide beta-1,3-galactosyltransferase n=1 Tax=Allomyces macrogynus (strain ATCC 38327) TaxID=578462 RepID=A0A0L0RXQ9_ALLM3|nr:hypothetical protein AMAG_00853 [Allomyces macrogynus ATCC 38327]|eukprot:KNE54909.1 hypothetical protein AMAG_00853 [Allomyces macrogynus ATCC 38327]